MDNESNLRPTVSVITLTYNHAPYIAEALDNILNQKTDFPIEIIVHDDASTDGTADIIRQYARKYPDIIKPILQTENQYSKGKNNFDFIIPSVRGKYTALCEGDDYWRDENKLRKQVDYLEAHPNCSCCYCNGYDVNVDGKVIGEHRSVEESRIISTEEILMSDGDFLISCGLICKSELNKEFCGTKFAENQALDLPFSCYMAMKGDIFCFEDKMVCYRRFVPGSWTMRVEKNKNRENHIQRCENMVIFYQRLNVFSQTRYDRIISEKEHLWQFKLYVEQSNRKKLLSPEYVEAYKKLNFRMKAIIFIKSEFPFLVKGFRLIRYGKKGLEKKY